MIGGAAGGGAGTTVVLTTKGEEIILEEGASFSVRLRAPFTVTQRYRNREEWELLADKAKAWLSRCGANLADGEEWLAAGSSSPFSPASSGAGAARGRNLGRRVRQESL